MKIDEFAATLAPQMAAQASPEIFQQLGHITRQLHDTLRELGVMPKLQMAADGLPDARSRLSYIARKTGEMAQAIGAFLHDPERGVCRAVMGATESLPVVFEDAAALFGGDAREITASRFDASVAMQALDAAAITDSVNRRLHVTALKRAIERATRA